MQITVALAAAVLGTDFKMPGYQIIAAYNGKCIHRSRVLIKIHQMKDKMEAKILFFIFNEFAGSNTLEFTIMDD